MAKKMAKGGMDFIIAIGHEEQDRVSCRYSRYMEDYVKTAFVGPVEVLETCH